MKKENIKITFPDGKIQEVEYGTEAGKLIEKMGLPMDYVRAARINNKLYSLDGKFGIV